MEERLKEILDYLDCDIYWKNCNFIQDYSESEEIVFYSRDLCRNITFRELLLWYLPRLGRYQDEPNCDECDNDYKCTECEEGKNAEIVQKKHHELFLELIDIYSIHKFKNYLLKSINNID